MHEHEQDEQGRQICTTSGEAPSSVRAQQRVDGNTGQHSSYVVLCDEERKKGFVRPYRDAYKHVGRSVCGKIVRVDPTGCLGGPREICEEPFGHDGVCVSSNRAVTQHEAAELERSHRKGGCNTVTTMGRALSETYARDPSFYGATFCVHCNAHFPVADFVWTADGAQVGS